MKFGFIGYGNMGSAIVLGMHKIGVKKDNIFVFNRTFSKIEQETEKFIPCSDKKAIFNECDIIFLGIKPQQYREFLSENRDLIKDKTIVSMAAGISRAFMEEYTENYIQIMPNTSVALLKGQTAIVKSKQKYQAKLVEIFEKMGEVYLINHKELHEYIALCGSSPAYAYEFINVFANSFENCLPEIENKEIIFASVVKAACEQVINGELTASQLRDNVMSKKGVTEQAIFSMQKDGIQQMASNAINACVNRSIEMELENDKNLQ